MSKISASIMCGNPLKFGEELKRLEAAKVDFIHYDMMDGSFVPNIAMGIYMLEAMTKVTSIPFDVHLAAWEPSAYYKVLAEAGATYLSIHPEAVTHLHRNIQQIEDAGMRPGVVINPGTHEKVLKHVIDRIDMVTVMTVNPGFAGQKFIDSQLEKIAAIRQMARDYNPDLMISVDGNINENTIPACVENGADVFVAGTSSIFKGDDADYVELVAKMRESIKK
ncbi:MAG TPA: ribulose-phosphate 3-epimerase [Eubacteriaceae bacterium]|nr:ribulose-phosphate 3-epimerase [Eubacteriaceae bacterium]